MSLPDFLVIGAMKCGTTTLAAQLAAQPGVFMTTPKEPNFFSDDEVFVRGMDWYESLYDAAPEGALRGEASTHYTKLPTHPRTIERMAAVLPAPRFIYMIREPVARAVSHYIHEWSQGLMGDDPVAAFARHPELVDYGRYGMQIAPFVEAYGAERIFLTSLERMKGDPAGELARIGAFLGAAEPFVWEGHLEAQNVSSARYRRFPLQQLILGNPVARGLRRTLVPKAVRERVREARTMKARPELPEALVARLRAEFAADRAQLARLFPGHPVLAESYPDRAA